MEPRAYLSSIPSTSITATSSDSISSVYHECLGYLNQLYSLKQTQTGNLAGSRETTRSYSIADELARFRIWAANSGAHHPAESRYSLDCRLQNAVHAKQLLFLVLGKMRLVLVIGVTQFTELDTPENSTLEDLSSTVGSMITLLYRVLMAIRKPSQDSYNSSKYSGIDVSQWEFFDKRRFQDKFPLFASTKEYLLSRLVQASLHRRRFFEYQKTHREKLARSGVGVVNQGDSVGENSEGTIITNMSTLVDLPQAGNELQGAVTEVDSDEGRTATSYASTMGARVVGDNLRVPPPPNSVRAYEGAPFECPYCSYVITAPDFPAWQRHVFRDLRPYVCTFEECVTPNQLFKSRSEWLRHELKFHRQEWYCNDCSVVFKDEKSLENHLKHVHPDACTPVLLPVVIKGCQRTSSSPERCALCTVELPAIRVRNHLARHLQQLALCSLPRRQDLNSDVEDKTLDGAEEDEGTDRDRRVEDETPWCGRG